jgi:hypothetical protein
MSRVGVVEGVPNRAPQCVAWELARLATLYGGGAARPPSAGIPDLGASIRSLIAGRDEIEQAGLTTTTELVNTLPQNFCGGPNENTVRGNGAETNSGLGSGMNLRGLSDDAALVLFNGRGLAPSGTAGAFTDIGNISLAAIDHMEVIQEGAVRRVVEVVGEEGLSDADSGSGFVGGVAADEGREESACAGISGAASA